MIYTQTHAETFEDVVKLVKMGNHILSIDLNLSSDEKEKVFELEKQGNLSFDMQLLIGYFYKEVLDEELQDHEKAYCIFENLMLNNYVPSYQMIGDMYKNGLFVEKNLNKAFEYFEMGAEAGDAVAQYSLGRSYYLGESSAKITPEESKMLHKVVLDKVCAGDAYDDGGSYNAGDDDFFDDETSDLAQAFYWFNESAKQRYSLAQYSVGKCYYLGKGVEKDYREAVKWYSLAAAQGEYSACFYLGYCYSNGYGVTVDYVLSMEWYKKAAEKNSAAALCNIGYLYENGFGVKKDKKEAAKY